MLLLTDLADWQRDPLESLIDAPPVKPRLDDREREAAALLGRLFRPPAPPHLARAGARAAAPGWLALAVVQEAGSSQYDALLEMTRAPAGLPGPVAALALAGRGFHGNRGRPWLAVPGNLHLCCAVPVDLELGPCAAAVPALAAVSVCDALARCAPALRCDLKWVNDVLIDGGKVAGVLAAAQSRGRRLVGLVFGIGINVAVAPPVTPTLFVPRATCLADEAPGLAPGVGRLTLALLDALGRRLDELRRRGAEPAVDAYRRLWGDRGRRVAVWAEGLPDTDDPRDLPPPLARGRALALDDDLSLLVDGAAAPLSGGRLARLDDGEPGREPAG